MAGNVPDIRDIFDAAVARDSIEERARYLDEACGDDAKVRERVEALLRAHSEAGGFFGGRSPAPPDPDDLPIAEGPGTVIGPYKLLQQIGEGGMGVVYMAEQEEPVERRVALKIIKPGMDTRQVIARFQAEHHALALMDHPNIARVLDAGATATGRPYFVMELVKGVPITQYCDEHHLTPRERLELFVPVCHAVQHAHQKGVIHRDLKPGNVLVAEYDDRPAPKIIDFGVAKAIQQRLTERTVFTQFGQVVGTIDYMSPEQAKLNELDVDTRSDVYSLGVLLYELLTGETPFDGRRLRAAAFDELLRIIREEDPPRPSLRLGSSESLPSIAANRRIEPGRLSSLVRGDLDWIVMKAMEKDRGRRYETANALAADVAHHLADEPVVACPPSAAYRLRKFARRNRAVLATLAIVGLVLLVSAAVSIGQAIRATKALQVAEEAKGMAERRAGEAMAARAEAERAAAEAQAVADFLVDDLLGSAAPKKTLGREVTVKEVLENAEKSIDGAFQEQPRREASIRHTMATAYRSLGQYGAAERHARRAVEVRSRLLGRDHPDTLRSISNLAAALCDQYKLEEAQQLGDEAFAGRKRVHGLEDRETLRSMRILGLVSGRKGRLEEARRVFDETLAIQRRVLGPEDSETLETMEYLAVALFGLDRQEEARRLQEQLLATRERVLGPEHPDTVASTRYIGRALIEQGNLDEARRIFEGILSARKRVLGPEHPETLNSMSEVVGAVKDRAEARRLREELLAVKTRVLGPEHPMTLLEKYNLACAVSDLGKLAEARTLYDETLAIQRRVLGTENAMTLHSMHNLAHVLYRLGRGDEARDLYEETLAILDRVFGGRHIDTQRTLYSLALAHRHGGKLGLAHRLSQRCLREMHETAMDGPGDGPLQERVASQERELCRLYRWFGLWDLAATDARHAALRTRVTRWPEDVADFQNDTDGAVFLAANGEQDAWRERCRQIASRLGYKKPPAPPTPWLIRTSCLLEPPALDLEPCIGSLAGRGNRSRFEEACLALALCRASRHGDAARTFTEDPLGAAWKAHTWETFRLWAGYTYALAAQGDGQSEAARSRLDRAEAFYQQICQATACEDGNELAAEFSACPWDLAAAQVLRREAWRKIAERSPPPEPWWRLVRARSYGRLGESEAAEKELDAAVASIEPGIWLVWAIRARIREQLGDSAGAEADRKRALELAPRELPEDDALPWTERARLHARAGRSDEAARDFVRAAELSVPRRWSVGSALFEALVQHEQVFARVAELAPDGPRLWGERGHHHALRSQWKEALTAYARAETYAQYHASALLLTGDEDGYRRLCEGMAERFGKTGEPNKARDLALVCRLGPRSGIEPERIVEWAELSLTSGRDKFRLEALALACYRAGRFGETTALIEEAMNLPDALPKSEAAFPLALACRALGKDEEGKTWYRTGVAELEAARPREPGKPAPWAPSHWLVVNVWYREARAVFEDPARNGETGEDGEP